MKTKFDIAEGCCYYNVDKKEINFCVIFELYDGCVIVNVLTNEPTKYITITHAKYVAKLKGLIEYE